MPNELVKISSLATGTPSNDDYTVFVDLADNTTKKCVKSDFKGDQGNAATINAGTTTTLAAGQSATVTNVGSTSAAVFNFAIPQGIQGLTGADGACVVSVAFVGNDMVFTLEDASTITLTNAKIDLKGNTGAKIVSAAFVGNDLVFTLDDSSNTTLTNGKTILTGPQGIQGITGATGKGITTISKTGTVGLVDTYTITYSDATTSTFNVTNGSNGTNGISFIWKGAYAGGTTYAVNDAVSYNGNSYMCKLSSTGNLPTNSTYFDLMAQKGADGTGSGDVMGPATNTADFIPQWNGANSKTLKDGLAVPAGGLAGITALNLKAPLASPVFTGNLSLNAMALGTQTIATAGGTTTFTVASPVYTVFTGSQGQTLVLPNATTLLVGQRYMIDNDSTQEVVINTNGGAELWRVAPNTDCYLQCLTIGTAAGTWEVDYSGTRVATSKKLTVNNTITLAGTDGTTMTFPTTSATIARTDAANTFTGVQTMTSPALTTPAISGISTGTGVATAASVNTLALRDANANISTANLLEGYSTTATAGTSTTLTVASNNVQVFTGSTTQTVVMPVTSTLALGQSYWIVNQSTGAVTVNSSGGNAIVVLAAGTQAEIMCILTSGTTAASWNSMYIADIVASGKKLTVNNTITLAGTDGQTYTFPTATGTIPSLTSTSRFTNKILDSKVVSAASYTTDTGTSLDVSTCNTFIVTAQAGALKFNNPSGTPTEGQDLWIRIKDNGTARPLTYDTQFRASSDLPLPTTTIVGKTLYMRFRWNATDTKLDLLAYLNNF